MSGGGSFLVSGEARGASTGARRRVFARSQQRPPAVLGELQVQIGNDLRQVALRHRFSVPKAYFARPGLLASQVCRSDWRSS